MVFIDIAKAISIEWISVEAIHCFNFQKKMSKMKLYFVEEACKSFMT